MEETDGLQQTFVEALKGYVQRTRKLNHHLRNISPLHPG